MAKLYFSLGEVNSRTVMYEIQHALSCSPVDIFSWLKMSPVAVLIRSVAVSGKL